jgi:serine/threonine-protein kinase
MAPEQAAGQARQAGPLTDVYALGAILYELLTGRPPFRAENPLETLLQVREREPDRPRLYNRQVDPALEAVCLKCLEKAPQDRYPSAASLAEDLAAYRRGEPVLAEERSGFRLLRVLLQETRYQEVMARWGRVLMCQAVLVFLQSLVLGGLQWLGCDQAWPYLLVNAVGSALLFVPVWHFRFRGGLPLTPLERQLAKVWSIVAAAVVLNAVIKFQIGPPPTGPGVWRLFAVSVLEFGIGFGCTAVILGGSFYVLTILCAFLALLAAVKPDLSPPVFGGLFAIGLFFSGWKFYRLERFNPNGHR